MIHGEVHLPRSFPLSSLSSSSRTSSDHKWSKTFNPKIKKKKSNESFKGKYWDGRKSMSAFVSLVYIFCLRFTRVQLFNQRGHGVGDGVSCHQKIVPQVPSRPWEQWDKKKQLSSTGLSQKPALERHLCRKDEQSFHFKFLNLFSPWENASWTSPPTPASESWGGYAWACGDAAPTGRTLDGLGRQGEAWEEPAAWAWETNRELSDTFSAFMSFTPVKHSQNCHFVILRVWNWWMWRWRSNTEEENLLPAAVPHPPGPQRRQNQGERKRKEKKTSGTVRD